MVRLRLNRGLQFTAEDDLSHRIIIDTKKEFGGFDQGFKPMDLLLVSLAGCMGMDIVGILQKKGGKIADFSIEVEGTRAEDHPHKFTRISVRFKCEGDYRQEDLVRSFELSRDKYCSVIGTLNDKPELDFVI